MMVISVILNVILLLIIYVYIKKHRFSDEFLYFCHCSILCNIDDINIKADNENEFRCACKSILHKKLLEDLDLDPEYKIDLDEDSEYALYKYVSQSIDNDDEILEKINERYIELHSEIEDLDVNYDCSDIKIISSDNKKVDITDFLNSMIKD